MARYHQCHRLAVRVHGVVYAPRRKQPRCRLVRCVRLKERKHVSDERATDHVNIAVQPARPRACISHIGPTTRPRRPHDSATSAPRLGHIGPTTRPRRPTTRPRRPHDSATSAPRLGHVGPTTRAAHPPHRIGPVRSVANRAHEFTAAAVAARRRGGAHRMASS